uniref:Uncharacterized protein n=1 Tax=Ascaris lumbricoides TaxID=6252 RepID=A0A0M3I9X1_ASCLU
MFPLAAASPAVEGDPEPEQTTNVRHCYSFQLCARPTSSRAKAELSSAISDPDYCEKLTRSYTNLLQESTKFLLCWAKAKTSYHMTDLAYIQRSTSFLIERIEYCMYLLPSLLCILHKNSLISTIYISAIITLLFTS